MPMYQNATVTDSKVETGNYAMYVATIGTTAGGTWTNLGAGMVKSFAYNPEMFTSQAGNAVDPIEGVARETATLEIDLIEYDGTAFSELSSGMWTGTTGAITVGGNVSLISGKAYKLVNTRKLAGGTSQVTTYVISKGIAGGFTMNPKSDNDSDPVNVYSFSITCKQYATAGTIFTKTVA